MLPTERMNSLAYKLYRADQVRLHEAKAAQQAGVAMYSLMQSAGESIYAHSEALFPKSIKYLVVVGSGNNAGDGYIAALTAKNAGKQVTLCAIEPNRTLQGDAATAQRTWLKAQGIINDFTSLLVQQCDIIIDGLLGTGVSGVLRPAYASAIDIINGAQKPIISIDVPSGLNANTGEVLGNCIQASATVTFIGVKQGLTTGSGKQASGQVIFEDLGISETFSNLAKSEVSVLDFKYCARLKPRAVNSHKGTYGRLLCIGGNQGMPGSIRMTAEAALRSGAGLVKVYCHATSILAICNGRPELMVTSRTLKEELDWATCIVMGPGLGQDEWAKDTFNTVMAYLQEQAKPVVIDADGLNLLAQTQFAENMPECVITPHAAEAARLLAKSIVEIEANRFKYARQCAQRYTACCVLKGAGSIVDNQLHAWVCRHGNPGMATAGMGDVLAGIIGALLAQNLEKDEACQYAVSIHAKAGDIVADKLGQRGLLATDLFDSVRMLINK